MMVETCPTCGGNPEAPIFYCGERYSHVEVRVCPFCGGLGEVDRARRSWPSIGRRLRDARLKDLVRIGDDNGRWVYTMDESVPLQPRPIYAQAHCWRVPERAVEQIEAGKLDPWSIAKHVSSMTWPLEQEDPHCATCRCNVPHAIET